MTRVPPRVGIAVVIEQGHALVGVRPAKATLAGLSEFPGGKAHRGESSVATAMRECWEETGLVISVDDILWQTEHRYAYSVIDISFHLCRLHKFPSGAPLPAPTPPFRWVPLSELASLEFPEANQVVLQLLAERFPGPLSPDSA